MLSRMSARLHADAVLIAGPTASGKSHAALALAEQIGGAIVNADSMQVYAETRVLTARPTDAEMTRAPHYLYGHVSVSERYSVGRYQADAAGALAEIRARGLVPIFVGGTGLYFTALTEGIADIPATPPEIRKAVEARRKKIGAEAFFAELMERDPEIAARMRVPDTQRTIRAREVFEATGRPLSQWQKELGQPVLAGFSQARFVIAPSRLAIYQRIVARLDRMMEEGGIEEALALRMLDPLLPAAKILGVREILAARAGYMSLDAAVQETRLATRQYAKRQMTWFRHRMKDWTWIEADDAAVALAEIRRALDIEP
jgi:tRNA dimethylallyltransferase